LGVHARENSLLAEVAVDKINGREDVIDMWLVAGEPNRFANASKIESTPLRRRLQLLLLVA
jgi:hypothetical protein